MEDTDEYEDHIDDMEDEKKELSVMWYKMDGKVAHRSSEM